MGYNCAEWRLTFPKQKRRIQPKCEIVLPGAAAKSSRESEGKPVKVLGLRAV